MKIALTIKSTYLPSWGVYEGVRELVQNARDAEVEHGAAMTVKHTGDKLVIENDGVSLGKDALLLGHTSKADRKDLIGQFGEGLKLGVLALVRAGCRIKILSGSECWVPSLEPSETFSTDVLTFDITPAARGRNRVKIEISGIAAEDWKTFKTCFRFLCERESDDDVCVPEHGTLLLAPRMAGRIFVKGIFVQKDEALAYGYDLAQAELDRDRRLIARWDLQVATRKVWMGALERRPELAEGFVKLLDKGKDDVAGIAEWNVSALPQAALQAVVASFTERHGNGAVPVRDFATSKDIAHLGKKGVVVSAPLASVLEALLGKAETVKEQLKTEVVTSYGYHELSADEAAVLEFAVDTVKKASAWEGDYEIVDFRSSDLQGQCDMGLGRIKLSRKMLADRREALLVMVHEAAHAVTGAGDGDKAHVAMIEEIWSRVWEGK